MASVTRLPVSPGGPRVSGAPATPAPSRVGPQEVHYRIAQPATGPWPGAHRSSRGDAGLEFRGHARLVDHPDARRLDLLASLRDPFGQWQVRLQAQRRALPVVVLADLSASMGFGEGGGKLGVLADLIDSLGASAWRTGDRFGFVGADAVLRDEWWLPPTRLRGAARLWADRLRGFVPVARGTQALALAQGWLGRQRALVFVVSDFHAPLDQSARMLATLAAHEVVPVVLWSAHEFDAGSGAGLASMQDTEGAGSAFVWWRSGLRRRWQAAGQARREALQAMFRAQRRRPLFIDGAFDAQAVTRYFAA